MDHHKEFRLTYLTAAPHSFYAGLAWITSAIIADYTTKKYGILVFIIALSLTFPGGELFRKFFYSANVLSKENRLGKLFMLSALTIPACYPIVLWVCQININYFFPAFSILVGAHYLIFVYAYDRMFFLFVASAMIVQAIFCVYVFPTSFSTAGYISGGLIFGTALINLRSVKKEYLAEGLHGVVSPEMKR